MTSFAVSCPLGDHSAEFDCEARTLDCPTCVYALSADAAVDLFRLADRVAALEAVFAEHLAATEPARQLATVLKMEAAA